MRVLIQDLAPGIEYNAQFRARGAESASEWSRTFILSSVVDQTPPKTPTSFTAKVNGSNFDLSWDAVYQSIDDTDATDLDHYQISLTAGGVTKYLSVGKEAVAWTLTLASNRSLFTTPKPSITFAIRAVDQTGNESPWSSPVTVSNPAPQPPTSFVATGGVETVYGSWTPPTDDDIKEYRVYIGTTSNFTPTTLIYRGAVPQFTSPYSTFDTNLWLKLYAVDVFDSQSTIVTAGPIQIRNTTSVDTVAPATPTALAATITTTDTSASAAVTWTPPANPDNDLAGYTVNYRTVGSTNWSSATVNSDSVVGAKTGGIIDKLTPYVNYEFRVRAFDYSFNASPWSATVTANGAVNTAPVAPTGVTISAGYQTAMVYWNENAESDVKGGAGTYEVWLDTTNAFNSPALQKATTAGTLMTFTNLNFNKTYFARVRAIDSLLVPGAWSAVVNSNSGMVASPTYVQSRGTDLVTNGTGLMGTNYNFTGFTFDASDTPVGANGSFWSSAYNSSVMTDENLPIDTSKQYVLSVQARQRVNGIASKSYTGLVPYDAYGGSIGPVNYMYRPGTTTTLAADLKPGDTTITLTSSQYWNNAAGAATYWRNIIFWDYVDAGGKQWGPETFSRNYMLDAYADGSIVGNVITLRTPYAGTLKPAGTSLSNGGSGGSFMYGALVNTAVPNVWTAYSSSAYGGVHVQNGALGDNPSSATTKFPPGTSSVKIIFLINRDVAGGQHAFANVSFSDTTAAQRSADSAQSTADTANNQVNAWKFTGKTTINGGAIEADTITALQIKVAQLAADTAFITALKVGDANILNMSADKIIANSSFINNLNVKSTFTLGDATNDGAIQSYGYIAGTKGFRLAKSGLEINEGSVAAKALNIQVGQNLMPAQYADFEWAPTTYSFYTGGVTPSIVPAGGKFNQQFLKIISNVTTTNYIMLAPSPSAYNVNVDAGTDYIISAYVKAGATASSTSLRVRYSDGTYSTQSVATPLAANGTWQRISTVITTPAGVGSMLIMVYVNAPAVGMEVHIDGVQVEKRLGAPTTPSTWFPPSTTTIDGGQVRTGEIRSTQNVTVNGVSQPAWLINTSGGAQFGNASIRGKLFVGGDSGQTDAGQSLIQSTNYLAGQQGWIIKSDGYAEFRNLAVNSIKVTTLDSPLQNTVATKLYDFLEDFTLWQVRLGNAIGRVNQLGAYSAKAMAEATGDTIVTRDSLGLGSGLAFEPEVLYRVTARVRQFMPADVNSTELPKTSIGVIGFDELGNVCGYDGTSSIFKQYEVAASGEVVDPFMGTNEEQQGWQTFIGYIKGRDSNTGNTIWPTSALVGAGGYLTGFTAYRTAELEPNYVPYGDLEIDEGVVTGWTAYGAGSATIVSDASVISGNSSLKLTGGGVRGAYTALSSAFPAGRDVHIRFTAQQTLGSGGTDTYAPYIVARKVGATVTTIATLPAQTVDTPDPVDYDLTFTVPTGQTMGDIYIYQTVAAGSTGYTVIDNVSAAPSSSPVASNPSAGVQRILSKHLEGPVGSGVKFSVPNPAGNAAVRVDFTRPTNNFNIKMQVVRGDNVVNEISSSDELSGTLSIPVSSYESGEAAVVRMFLEPLDSTVPVDNVYADFSNFDMTIGAGSARDQYNPAALHDNVRYIAPYVRLNESSTTAVAQLDAFTIETFEAGAQQKVSTGEDVTSKSVTIENIDDSETGFDHAVRFYSGEPSESLPGIIGQNIDEEHGGALALTIAPPRAGSAIVDYGADTLHMRSKNANILINSSFDDDELGLWSVLQSADSTLAVQDGIGEDGGRAAVLTSIQVNAQGLHQYVNIDDNDGWGSVTTVTVSGNFMPMTVDAMPKLRFRAYGVNESGADVLLASLYSPLLPSAPANQWTRVYYSFDLPDGIPEGTVKFDILYYVSTETVPAMAVGQQWAWDKLQVEAGDLTEYKPQANSVFEVNTEATFVSNSLAIGPTGTGIDFTGFLDGFVDASHPGKTNYPTLMLNSSVASYYASGFEYDDNNGTHRAFLEISGKEPSTGLTTAGGLRIYSMADEYSPGRVLLFNKNNKYLLYSKDKTANPDLIPTTGDIGTDGWMTVMGEPPWRTLQPKAKWAHATTTYGYVPGAYVNGNEVRLRGTFMWAGGSTMTTEQTMTTLPEGYRPVRACRFSVVPFGNGASSGNPIVLRVNTGGNIDISYIGTSNIPDGSMFSLDGITFYVGSDLTNERGPSYTPGGSTPTGGTDPTPPAADTTAPGKPSAFSISARSSGASTGSYTLKWTNPGASDLAGVKILWRTDRYPSVTIPSSGKKTLKTDGKVIAISGSAGQSKSYVHTSLPVNKYIYYRLVAYDKSGNHSSYISGKRYLLKSPIVITANSSATWGTNYSAGWQIPGGGDDLIQAQYSGYSDNYRGLWFYGTKIYDNLNKGGVRRTPTSMKIYMYRKNSSHGTTAGVGINLYEHVHASKPGGSGAPNLNSSKSNICYLKRGGSATVTIPSGWYGSYASGYNKGFAVFSTSSSDYAILTGHSSYASNGKVTIYHKG